MKSIVLALTFFGLVPLAAQTQLHIPDPDSLTRQFLDPKYFQGTIPAHTLNRSLPQISPSPDMDWKEYNRYFQKRSYQRHPMHIIKPEQIAPMPSHAPDSARKYPMLIRP